MFAVIKTGGKQYKVQVGETIDVEKLPVEVGTQVQLDEVLLAAGDGDVSYGRPAIDGAVVTARVVRQHRGPKLTVFKYKSKSRYRRRTGHRQSLTQLLVQTISIPGWEPVTLPSYDAPEPAADDVVRGPGADADILTVEQAPAGGVEDIDIGAPVADHELIDEVPGDDTDLIDEAPEDSAGGVSFTAGSAPSTQGSAAPPHDVLPPLGPSAQVDATDAVGTPAPSDPTVAPAETPLGLPERGPDYE